ncbi:hypothetical protein DPSP01_006635 [Paraphaeosphaeria sporulosa]
MPGQTAPPRRQHHARLRPQLEQLVTARQRRLAQHGPSELAVGDVSSSASTPDSHKQPSSEPDQGMVPEATTSKPDSIRSPLGAGLDAKCCATKHRQLDHNRLHAPLAMLA